MKNIIKIAITSIFCFSLAVSAVLANYGNDNRLWGYVKEYHTFRILPGAKVKLYRKSGSLKDIDKASLGGKYKFTDLKEKTYRVKVSMVGYRNPRDIRKNSVSRLIEIDGSTRKNLYLEKI
jgi:hypothetical protein